MRKLSLLLLLLLIAYQSTYLEKLLQEEDQAQKEETSTFLLFAPVPVQFRIPALAFCEVAWNKTGGGRFSSDLNLKGLLFVSAT